MAYFSGNRGVISLLFAYLFLNLKGSIVAIIWLLDFGTLCYLWTILYMKLFLESKSVLQLVHIFFAEVYSTNGFTCWTRCSDIDFLSWSSTEGRMLLSGPHSFLSFLKEMKILERIGSCYDLKLFNSWQICSHPQINVADATHVDSSLHICLYVLYTSFIQH